MSTTTRLERWILRLVDQEVSTEVNQRIDELEINQNEFGFDSFGLSKDKIRSAMLLGHWMHRHYFRTEVYNAEHIPAQGRVFIVGNHSGQLPYDGAVVCTSAFFDTPSPRLFRSMAERYIPTVPFVSYLLSRWGQTIGTPENCRRLLEAEEAILVFPEGVQGITKPYSKRYQLQEFGNGFMRLALETNTPIVPVAIIGAEEQAPGAINITKIAKWIDAPAFPIVPYPPFVPLIPLPVKYRIYFGRPMIFEGNHDDYDEVISEFTDQVKANIENMLHQGLQERTHVFW